MINFQKFTLDNGLRVIVHQDKSTPLVAVNSLYDVGARDENPAQTGFAHLFEHLMFGGSVNIPDFDNELQRVGGENNAFTSNDITNYYITLPKNNLETAFWLESDRMLSLAFSEKSLEVQRNVVIEEFKQSYLNKPYGDVWLLLKPLAYKVHPYLWSTIGKELSHIENATMADVRAFFKKHYCPNNAILVVAGDVEVEQIKTLTEKWFGSIPKGEEYKRNLPIEPPQKAPRTQTVERDVPYDNIYKAYHICARTDKEFYATDLLSEVLSHGNSAPLYIELVKNKKLFTDIGAYLSGDIDKGLFVISGKLVKGVSMEQAEQGIQDEINKIKKEKVAENILTKAKNQMEATLEFSEMSVLNKAMNLANAELLGDAALINKETENYLKVTTEEIYEQANIIFNENNCSTLYYLAKKN